MFDIYVQGHKKQLGILQFSFMEENGATLLQEVEQ